MIEMLDRGRKIRITMEYAVQYPTQCGWRQVKQSVSDERITSFLGGRGARAQTGAKAGFLSSCSLLKKAKQLSWWKKTSDIAQAAKRLVVGRELTTSFRLFCFRPIIFVGLLIGFKNLLLCLAISHICFDQVRCMIRHEHSQFVTCGQKCKPFDFGAPLPERKALVR
jgi:hypothetical protein